MALNKTYFALFFLSSSVSAEAENIRLNQTNPDQINILEIIEVVIIVIFFYSPLPFMDKQ